VRAGLTGDILTPSEVLMRPFLLIPLLSFACKETTVEVSGKVDGEGLKAASAYWGGPYLVITDAQLECVDMPWVREAYDDAESNDVSTDERFKALQFTYESSEIEESKLSIRSRDAPALAWFLQISDGEADATQATSGTIDLTMDGDWVEGTFELTFGDSGSLDGEFVVEKCTNLKKRKYE
jgi:hypothetical protein